MRHMDRERESSVSRLFLQVTPEMRRALEHLAAASIALLDEIDAPAEDLEDPDDEDPDEDGDDADFEDDDAAEDDEWLGEEIDDTPFTPDRP